MKIEKNTVYELQKVAVDKLYNNIQDRFYLVDLTDSVEINVHNNNCTKNYKLAIGAEGVILYKNGKMVGSGKATESTVENFVNKLSKDIK